MTKKKSKGSKENKSSSNTDKHSIIVTGAFAGLTTDDIKQTLPASVNGIQWMDLLARAVVTFQSEEDADTVQLELQNKQVGGEVMSVLHVGDKNRSKFKPISKSLPSTFNLRALLVDDVPEGTTVDDLKKAFPKANKVDLASRSAFAEVHFENELDAEKAFLVSENLKIKGNLVTVVYASGEAKRQYTLGSCVEQQKLGKRIGSWKNVESGASKRARNK
jgi:RNA recognition motif-containing protein